MMGLRVSAETDIFVFDKELRLALGPTQIPIKPTRQAVLPGVKWLFIHFHVESALKMREVKPPLPYLLQQ
jgi:hypothetical protein